MIRYPGAKKPYQDIGNEVASEENGTSYFGIEEEQDWSQKQKWNWIRDQVGKVGMDHRRRKYPDQSRPGSWKYAEPSEIYSVEDLHGKGKPHDKDKANRDYWAAKNAPGAGHLY